MSTPHTTQRPVAPRTVLTVSAVAAGVLPLVGNGLYDGGGSSGTAVLQEAEEGLPTIGYLAYPLELLGFVALAVFLACLVVRLALRAPVAAATTGVAGSAMVAVKVGSAAPMMALQVNHDGVEPATAQLVSGLNDAGFIICGLLLSVALTAAGTGLLRDGLPRWLCWWAVVAGVLGTGAGIIGVVSPEAYLPIPFLMLLIWMIAVGLTTALRSNHRIPVGRPLAATE